jgi:hypothetical protein
MKQSDKLTALIATVRKVVNPEPDLKTIIDNLDELEESLTAFEQSNNEPENTCNTCSFHDGSGWCMKIKTQVGINQSCPDYFRQQDKPTAYEWHNLTTGHCYVDYVPHIGMDEKDGYAKIPLFK